MGTKKYIPSNGSEGEFFMIKFCFKCQFYDDEQGCPILNATQVNDVGDPEYPSQWICESDLITGKCTAFMDGKRKGSLAPRMCKADL